MKTIDETPDYEIAAAQLRDFYAGLGIDSRISPEGLRADDDGWRHHAYEVRFHGIGNASHFCRIDWRQGTGITDDLEPAEVLASAARDYADARGLTFEDWAGNLGYDTDSRKAEKTYDACMAMGDKLTTLGLTDEQIDTLAEFAGRL